MDWPGLIKLLHVALAMALVTGVIGRWLLLGSAERSETMERTEALAVIVALMVLKPF